ncbi:MAG: AEC family transporter [Peptococcaceae bacterium]
MIFFNVVLPVLLMFGIGFVVQKKFALDIQTVSTIGLYVFLPALVFKTMYEAQWSINFLHISIYLVILVHFLILLNLVINKFLKLQGDEKSALILATSFMNNGNFGVPIALLAFGEKAFSYSIFIMIIHTILMSTTGIYIAARGKASFKAAVHKVVKNPIIHSVYLAIFWNIFQIPLPESLLKVIDILAQGAIPLIMITLSMQLAEIKLNKIDLNKLNIALFVRLILSPLLVFTVLSFLNLDPLLEKVMILQAGMPTAAIITMYALEYDVLPDFVSTVTFISTVLSMLTLTIILTFLT